ncbi:primosomal protein N' [Paludicola sp. MB14-C6]|uniref:replication restart helicase PriA n=1 Tax=Paludihabitans sp. MB14-C6 TaxID=3070656 RepID=UPI0027DBB820|nr:primosomal protein N' [Paludicola sp. MB14-C6]WMJ22376.1 primosomal protein N' [Paludicola sp. MB14-C6]
MQQRMIAKVYVEKSVYHIDQAFDYIVPSQLINTLKRGCRVLVPFGQANKKVQGLVKEVLFVSEFEGQLKPILAQLDQEPIFDEEMFLIMDFLVKNTFCTYYEAVKTILPTGTNVDVIETYKLSKAVTTLELAQFNENEKRLIEFLKTAKTKKELSDFLDCSSNLEKKAVVKSLLLKGVIEKEDLFKQKVATKTAKMVRIADGFDPQGVKLTPKQQEVVRVLQDVSVAMIKEVAYFCGVTEAVVKALIKKHILETFERVVEIEYEEIASYHINLSDIVLSKEQQDVFDGIMSLVNEKRPHVALLHGVTGSGKTQVYIKLIEKVLQENKTAMLLVPEIALTPQLVSKFESLFGNIIAVIHSNLTPSERLEFFKRIKANQIKIVIGTRSAVFSPLQNIGVMILDEEGEASYKSDQSPRYHAREIAKLRCVTHNATLVLGSATPSIESFYQARNGKYSLFTMQERYATAQLPSVYIIDMLEEQKLNNLSPLSEILQQQLKLNLDQHEQSILLINRRGYQSYATCMQCGEVIKCPSCDVAMTYHKANGYLMCHYCGHTKKFDALCPSCHSPYIKLTGVGTQKLEDEVQSLFPKARILRMDTDTTYSRHSYEKNFGDFKRGKYDIMLGTQMIAKGLDFPNVTLVGVINADSGLYSTDYRSSERIFSLITQVVGRSGRSQKAGRAYIQTFEPDNAVIQFAAQQDYGGFYEDEIQTRKLLTYPPFCDICMLGFSGVNEKAVQIAANKAMEIIRQEALKTENITLKVLGVTPASIHKISNKYRYRILMKCRMNNTFKMFLSKVLKECAKERWMQNVSIFADINGDVNS